MHAGPAAARKLLRKQSDAGQFGLPLDLLARARGRLRVILYLALFGGSLSFSVRLWLALQGQTNIVREWVGITYTAVVAVVAALCLLLSRLAPESPSFGIKLGLFSEVLIGYVIAFGNTAHEVTKHGHLPFLTWAIPLMVVFPLIVPCPPRVTLLAAVITGSSAPVSVFLLDRLGMFQAHANAYVEACISPTVAALIAFFGSRVVYGLSVDYANAKRAGSYVLKTRIAMGGMGEVWHAEHQLLARPAAVKLVRRDWLDRLDVGTTALLERFQREAQATALLRSPHTVELYDYGVASDGSFFYVMELLEGLDLDTLVTSHGPLLPERAVHILRQACASLAEAHENGLVHRDVKPANVYLCQYGLTSDFVKVLDFGLVKAARSLSGTSGDLSLTSDNSLEGTPAFMAPEQATGNAPVGPHSDVYALGCVGYWMLTGGQPFEGKTPLELLMHHVRTPAPAASAEAPHPIPPELDQLLLDCMAKDPASRPAGMQALSRRLDAIRFERPWTQERACAWWEEYLPQVAARRTSLRAKKPETAA